MITKMLLWGKKIVHIVRFMANYLGYVKLHVKRNNSFEISGALVKKIDNSKVVTILWDTCGTLTFFC